MFVDTSRVPITADGEIDHSAVTPDIDVIYIRRRMDYGTSQKVFSALTNISGEDGVGKASLDFGAFQVALAQHNILDWSGPGFAGIPCTPKNILRLDPAERILIVALNAIQERNKDILGALLGGGDQKKSTPAGALNGAAPS